MRLHEYQSKLIFSRYGIPIPRGQVASTASEVKLITEELGGRVVVKAQVLVGGRGKAGGIRLAKTPKEAEEFATIILGMDLKGLPVRRVLVDEAVSFIQEVYLAVTIDRAAGCPVMIASAAGGMDIELVAERNPEKIIKLYIDPLLGLRDYQIRDIAAGIDLPRTLWRSFTYIAQGLWHVYSDNDATMAEINPLVVTTDQRLVALDGKMIIDDNALFRRPEQVEMRDMDVDPPSEMEAHKYGVSYIQLKGNIGCMVNGAGLAMATMDIIHLFGGEPANFLDIGGGASAEKVVAALRLLFSTPGLKAVLINVFGGITRCDEVARGIIASVAEVHAEIPIVVRLVGTRSEEGLRMLAGTRFILADTLEEAARKVIAAAEGAKP